MTGFDLRMLLTQTKFAFISALRNQRTVVFGIVFPIFLLILFNSIFAKGSHSNTHFGGGTIPTKAYFTAGLAAYAIALQTFTQIAVSVTTERESGELKRLRGTPMPAWSFIVAYLLRSIVLVAAVVGVLFAIGGIAFGVSFHGAGILGILVYTILGVATMAALGMAVTIFTPTVESASAVGPFSIVILSFISGVFLPTSELPDWLRTVGKFFPLQHISEGLQLGLSKANGTGLVGKDIVPLLIWLAVGVILAVRRFRWEPQGR
jgi:ABC-2 type transport system permease protein